MDCEQTYIELRGQCLKILRKAIVDVETVNVSNSETSRGNIFDPTLVKRVKLSGGTSKSDEGISDRLKSEKLSVT